jgi:hypothetical protein
MFFRDVSAKLANTVEGERWKMNRKQQLVMLIGFAAIGISLFSQALLWLRVSAVIVGFILIIVLRNRNKISVKPPPASRELPKSS